MAKAFTSNIDFGAIRGVPEDIGKALEQAAERIVLADSNRRVPYDTGDLKRSGKVVRVDPGKVAITYTDGGAVAAHEKLNVPPGNGRERKYLESAMNSTRPEVLGFLADAGRESLK